MEGGVCRGAPQNKQRKRQRLFAPCVQLQYDTVYLTPKTKGSPIQSPEWGKGGVCSRNNSTD